MPTFKKISGKWQECQALVKEGGAWKEIGAVTAKANGKWADIAPPKPAGKHWTTDDFTYRVFMGSQRRFIIKDEAPQYFTVGDTFDIDPGKSAPGALFTGIRRGTIPGVAVQDGKLVGTIEGVPATEDTLVIDGTENGSRRSFIFQIPGNLPIPIKPAP